ncbi:MAG: hypothetical protein IJ092_11440 [Atopobiaceae bacterium]|nr:hypothetical protein [Atopobiaceae bacterium]
MNQLAKNLKISCIACLFIGLAALVIGIVVGLRSVFDVDALATVACGLGSTPAGAQASRLANVPSNAKKVRAIALIALVACCAFLGVAVALGNPVPEQIGVLALAAFATLLMSFFSHKQVKELERV